MRNLMSGAIGIAALAAVASLAVSAQQNQTSFFITSAGPGNGANLGGLAGADKRVKRSQRPPARATARGARI